MSTLHRQTETNTENFNKIATVNAALHPLSKTTKWTNLTSSGQ